ncbi:hypothetical protein GF380_01510 [Candidatus Uhrbacteria bacterium]|nr:hypothetical protein [Candidatus Uhrbacteria bacterium]
MRLETIILLAVALLLTSVAILALISDNAFGFFLTAIAISAAVMFTGAMIIQALGNVERKPFRPSEKRRLERDRLDNEFNEALQRQRRE